MITWAPPTGVIENDRPPIRADPCTCSPSIVSEAESSPLVADQTNPSPTLPEMVPEPRSTSAPSNSSISAAPEDSSARSAVTSRSTERHLTERSIESAREGATLVGNATSSNPERLGARGVRGSRCGRCQDGEGERSGGADRASDGVWSHDSPSSPR